MLWAALGAGGCAFLFYWSTWPYAIPDEPPGPGWISLIAFTAALPALAWAAVPVPLLITGLVHLRRTRPGRWRRQAAWIAAGAAGIGLEALMVAQGAVPYVSPSYAGPAVVAWDSLAQAAGFLVIGAVMMRTLSGPPQSARYPAASAEDS
jgi:hypothetical protein